MGRRKKSLGKRMLKGSLKLGWKGVKGVAKGTWWGVKKTGSAVSKKTKKIKEEPSQYSSFEIKDEVKGKYSLFEKKILSDSLIIAIAGKRGSGKSTLGFKLMENIHAKKKRTCFVLGVKQKMLPTWIKSVKTLDEVKNKGVVLVDEGAVDFSSRSSMSKRNKELGELLAIARHKDLSLILVTQNTGMLDKNVLNLCDVIILKEGSLLQSEMERVVIKKLYAKVGKRFQGMNNIDKKKHSFIFDSDFEGFVANDLPSFWSDKISKSRA